MAVSPFCSVWDSAPGKSRLASASGRFWTWCWEGGLQAEPGRWHFLTGPRAELYRLATRNLLLVVVDNSAGQTNAPQDLFLHSTKLILLDPRGRLRGVYDGENPKVVSQLVPAVRKLLRERS